MHAVKHQLSSSICRKFKGLDTKDLRIYIGVFTEGCVRVSSITRVFVTTIPYIRSRLRARAPRNSGLALVVEDEADYDSEAYHDVWAEIGVWLSPGMRRSPLRPRGGQIPIILSTATPCHDPRPPLQSWDMVPSTHDEQEVTKIDVGKGNPAERLLLTSTLSCVSACLWPRIASRFAKPCQ